MYEIEPITFSMIFFFMLQLILVCAMLVIFIGVLVIAIDKAAIFANKLDDLIDKKEKKTCLEKFICHMIVELIVLLITLAMFSYFLSLLFN